MNQLELDIGDRPRLVRGPDGMYFFLPAGDTLAAMKRDYPKSASKLEVVPWPKRLRFR